MSTNSDQGYAGRSDPTPDEPEENLATTAMDPTFSSFDFDRDHGSEVEAARRELVAQWEAFRSAA